MVGLVLDKVVPFPGIQVIQFIAVMVMVQKFLGGILVVDPFDKKVGIGHLFKVGRGIFMVILWK